MNIADTVREIRQWIKSSDRLADAPRHIVALYDRLPLSAQLDLPPLRVWDWKTSWIVGSLEVVQDHQGRWTVQSRQRDPQAVIAQLYGRINRFEEHDGFVMLTGIRGKVLAQRLAMFLQRHVEGFDPNRWGQTQECLPILSILYRQCCNKEPKTVTKLLPNKWEPFTFTGSWRNLYTGDVVFQMEQP